MLGRHYFETRSKLGNAVYALARLGEEVSVNPSHVSLLRNMMASLKEPFMFTVVGEVNAGKSTLLNALFGKDFCSTNVIPTTDRISLFKHGAEPHELEISKTLVEVYRPAEFLKDFNVVDTPGTNSIELQHQAITERFIPMADLVIFVFSITNPWGATTWELLDRIHRDWRKKVIFVLQQTDLRSDEEVLAILSHLRRVSRHRLGSEFPTFAVSAKKAFLSKTTGLDKERLWEESHFEEFENYISYVVESSEVRLEKLISTTRTAQYVLNEIKQKLKTATNVIRIDNDLLAGLDQAAANREARTRQKFEPFFQSLDNDFVTATINAEKALMTRLGVMSSLKGPGVIPLKVERKLLEEAIDGARAKASEAANVVEDDVAQLWERVSDEMEHHFKFRMRVGDSGSPEWNVQRDRLVEYFTGATERVFDGIDLADDLVQLMSWRRIVISLFLSGAVVALFLGVLLSVGKVNPYNVISFGVGVAALLGGAIYGNRSMNRLIRQFGERMAGYRERLREMREKVFLEQIHAFYQDFVRLFEPLRRVCAEHRERYEPQLNLIESLDKTFGELGRTLAPVEQALVAQKREEEATESEAVS